MTPFVYAVGIAAVLWVIWILVIAALAVVLSILLGEDSILLEY